jgi:tetraacyldisaccharide 4'-kinase
MKALDSKIDSLLDIQISVDNAHLCLVAADAGLVKSGTSTLEAGLLRCPHTLIYKPTWVTAWIFKNLIRYRGPVGLANLIVHWQEGDQPVQSREGTLVKELLCEQVSVPALTREIVELLTDSQRRMKMLQGFELLRDLVFQKKGPQSHSSHPSHSIEMTSPSENAAREVIDVWDGLQAQAQSQGHAMLRISSTAKNWPNPLIFLGSLVWSCASALGRYAADRGWLKRQRLDARVISVGNIQVGGAGKTPLVARIAREAIEKGLRTCILSRGYRGHWELHGGVILPNSGPADAELCGDEVALLHDLVPQAYIVVGKNRAEQFFKLQKQGTPSIQLVILDDGFQHHKIQKDLEILAMTSAKPSQILFRDFHQASKKADLLVWTQGMPRELSWSGDLVDDSARVVMQYCLAEASRSEWKQTYWLVTGVFQGARVYELACSVGYPIARHLQFKDHFGYTNSAVREILSQASQKGVRVLLPGKDWVKWRSLGVSREEVQVIEPELIFKEGRSNWDQKLWAQQR